MTEWTMILKLPDGTSLKVNRYTGEITLPEELDYTKAHWKYKDTIFRRRMDLEKEIHWALNTEISNYHPTKGSLVIAQLIKYLNAEEVDCIGDVPDIYSKKNKGTIY